MTPAHPQNDPGEDPQPPRTPKFPAKRTLFHRSEKVVNVLILDKNASSGTKWTFSNTGDYPGHFRLRTPCPLKRGPRAQKYPSLAVPKRPVTQNTDSGVKFLGALCLRGHTLTCRCRWKGTRPRILLNARVGPSSARVGAQERPKMGEFCSSFPTCMPIETSQPEPQGHLGRVHLDVYWA